MPSRERELHLRQHLPARCAERGRRLDGVRGDAADPERGDADRRRDGVDHRRHDRGARADREQDHDRHQVRERGDDLHRVQHRRDRAVEACGAPGDHPERDADSSDSATAESTSANVSTVSSQRPSAAKLANAARTRNAARRPPKRSTTSVPSATVPAQVSLWKKPSARRRGRRGSREAVERAEGEVRVGHVAVVAQPDLEAVEVRAERVPRQPAGQCAWFFQPRNAITIATTTSTLRPTCRATTARAATAGSGGRRRRRPRLSRLRRRSLRARRSGRRRPRSCRPRSRRPAGRWPRSRARPCARSSRRRASGPSSSPGRIRA